MTFIEFYEKHWLVNGKNPPLTEYDREIFEIYEKVHYGEYLGFIRNRKRKRTDHLGRAIMEMIKQFPPEFMVGPEAEKVIKFRKLIKYKFEIYKNNE